MDTTWYGGPNRTNVTYGQSQWEIERQKFKDSLKRHQELLEQRKDFDAKCHLEMPANELLPLIQKARDDVTRRYGKKPTKIYLQSYIKYLLLQDTKRILMADTIMVDTILGMEIVEVPRTFVFDDHSIQSLPISFGFD